MNRRTFLKLSGVAAVSAAALQGVRWKQPALQTLAQSEKESAAAGEIWRSTLCLQCDAGCGIRAKIVDGRMIKIEGNPLFPTNQGSTCSKGQAGTQVLYHPDRIKWPLERTGARGAGEWRRIAWPEALSKVAQRLKEIRESGKAHTVAFMSSRDNGHMHALISRFMEALGSPNLISLASAEYDGISLAHELTQGSHKLGYDLANTRYLLSFGAGFATTWLPAVETLRLYGEMRQGKEGVRPKIVQAEPWLSVSAAKSDEWVPIAPGTEGALALGIAHVLIKEGLYDKSFVERYTFGFDDWTDSAGAKHKGFKTLVMEKYSPDVVAGMTGATAGTIARIAREFARHSPALAVGGKGSAEYTNSVYSLMAVHSLNALVGSINVPGGVRNGANPEFSVLPEVKRDRIAAEGLSRPRLDGAGTTFPLAHSAGQALARSILDEKPYQTSALFLYNANPLYTMPDAGSFGQALANVPFVVSFSPFMDETSEQADLIMPDHTFLEKTQDYVAPTNGGYPLVGLSRPAIEPLYDTAHTGDVLIRIGKEIGGTVNQSLPWNSFQEMMVEGLNNIHSLQRGSIKAATRGEFWEKLEQAGGWWDKDFEPDPAFHTPSGKFEFYSQALRQKLEAVSGGSSEASLASALNGLKIAARGDEAFLPHHEPPRFSGDEKEYHFYFSPYKPAAYLEGTEASQPWILEAYEPRVNGRWDSWIEMNPETASELGFHAGDEVWVESPLGRINTRVKLFEGARPDTVNMPFGFGHTAYGQWGRGNGANPNRILPVDQDRLGGLAAANSTRVKVYRV